MRVAITGSTGLVGAALVSHLQHLGHRTVPLSRDRLHAGIFWDPLSGEVGPGLEAVDAIVHLAGAPIAAHPWSEATRQSIRDSRVIGTQTLVTALLPLPPKVLISTSAVGYYGDCGAALLDESSPPGEGFLADVCVGWEAATLPAEEAGWRVATVRVGLVLSKKGGLLSPLLPLFRLGLGGPIAGGQQYMSWIHLDDLVALYVHLLTEELSGVFNGTAPAPVSNAAFTRALGRALHRPTLLPTPAFALRMALGRQKADALVLSSQRISPRRALQAGLLFQYPSLDEALAYELG